MNQPSVTLVNVFSKAYDNFIATARTCYSGKGIVDVDAVSGTPDLEPSEIEKRRERKNALASALFKAGHHTTLQHAHVQFALDGVSRHFIWSFLHSHPFYNSEQVSQRYVSVKEDHFYVPDGLTGRTREMFLETVRRQMADYATLCDMLTEPVAQEYYARFNGRHGSKRAENDIKKRAQEVARYVLPIGTCAYLYHTISVLTLMRYRRLCLMFDAPTEQRVVVQAMVDALLAREPEFAHVLQDPMPIEDTPEYAFFTAHHNEPGRVLDTLHAAEFVEEFDAELGAGRFSRLVAQGSANEQNVAQAVRETLGLTRSAMSDDDALELVLNPARNTMFGESLNLTTHGKLSRALHHAQYTFRKKMSHAGDSQNQRHRLTPGSRPVLMAHYSGHPDYIVPLLLESPSAARAREFYDASMSKTWHTMNNILQHGVAPELAAYLLPNAVSVRFTESGDLLNLHHKMAMRLCYNAQEEIWRASLDEARDIAAVNPRIGRWLLPPCGLRKCASAKPICPEGDKYCGVPVWRLEREQYTRVI